MLATSTSEAQKKTMKRKLPSFFFKKSNHDDGITNDKDNHDDDTIDGSEKEDERLQKMMDVRFTLEEYCGRGSVSRYHFDLEESSCMDFATAREIFDFIWESIRDINMVYRRFGIKQADKERLEGQGRDLKGMSEFFMKNAPQDILDLLDIAIAEAVRRNDNSSSKTSSY